MSQKSGPKGKFVCDRSSIFSKKTTIWCLASIILHLGYVVFASTLCGDSYCFDLNRQRTGEPEIVLISHEVAYDGITTEEAAQIAKPVASNLVDFLAKFTNEQIDEECIE